jgi:hypothetical protein
MAKGTFFSKISAKSFGKITFYSRISDKSFGKLFLGNNEFALREICHFHKCYELAVCAFHHDDESP